MFVAVALFVPMDASATTLPKGSVTGNFGTVSLDCSIDDEWWYMDITLRSRRGAITSYTGVVGTSIPSAHGFGGFPNPPTVTVYDQVQRSVGSLQPGTYTATLTGTGTTVEGAFALGSPSCSITVN